MRWLARVATPLAAAAAAAGAQTVRPARATSGQTPAVTRVPIDATQGVNFRAAVDRTVVYVGEQLTYQVGVFLDDDTRHRLRRNPEFTPPESRAMLAYDLPSPPGPAAVRLEGNRRYEVHVFQRALFPLTPGRAVVPPARLSYAVPLSNSFFSREERRTARADSLIVLVRPTPVEGRPADYRGAVGRLAASLDVDPAGARVGDPLVVTVRITGRGNVKLLPRPELALDWAQAVPSGERVTVDSVGLAIGGTKAFEWLVTPRRAGEQTIASIRYPYFDPEAERYELALTAPRVVTIEAGALAAADSDRRGPAAADVPTIRARFGGELPVVLPHRPWFWAATALAPFPALLVGALRTERRRRRRSAAEELRTVARERDATAKLVRRRFTAALVERVPIGAAALVSEATVARALRRAGVTTEVAREAATLLAELNAAAYAAAGSLPGDAAVRAQALYERIDAEARHRLAPPLWQWLLVLGGAGSMLAASATARDTREVRAESAFTAGVRAYGDRRYTAAAVAFAEATTLAPRSVDAWANRGTAAWVAGDTAAATIGWQRATRLDPLASDVRDRLLLLPGDQLGGPAWVPPVPVSWAASAALALWAAACGLACVRAARRAPRVTRATGALATAAAAWGAVAWVADDARRAERLDVVVVGGETRAAPALGAEAGPALHRGEVVRVLARRDAWARVSLAGGRDGWVAGEWLVPLRAD